MKKDLFLFDNPYNADIESLIRKIVRNSDYTFVLHINCSSMKKIDDDLFIQLLNTICNNNVVTINDSKISGKALLVFLAGKERLRMEISDFYISSEIDKFDAYYYYRIIKIFESHLDKKTNKSFDKIQSDFHNVKNIESANLTEDEINELLTDC